MTPTHGLCHSVFLLAQAATVKPRQTVESWVKAALRSPTFMAIALDLESAARILIKLDLARIDRDVVQIDQRLSRAGTYATLETLALIAQTLLSRRPPPWLGVSVENGAVLDEWMPTSGQRDLEWLGDFRDPILVGLHRDRNGIEEFCGWLGGVGEGLVVAIERHRGCKVRHVARISDAFGFDVASVGAEGRKCLEVKTTLESGVDRFFISKHEIHTAAALKDEWCLLQVVLNSTAVTEGLITRNEIQSVRFLTSAKVLALAPIDTSTGEWIDSARISAPHPCWSDWPFEIPLSWCVRGLSRQPDSTFGPARAKVSLRVHDTIWGFA